MISDGYTSDLFVDIYKPELESTLHEAMFRVRFSKGVHRFNPKTLEKYGA